MAAQVSDILIDEGKPYELCGVQGEGLFDPAIFDIELEAPDTSCFRGFMCVYEICDDHLELAQLELWSDPTFWNLNRAKLTDLFGTSATINGEHPKVNATDLGFPICFTGGLLVGDDFIHELYKPMGFRPPYAYRDVHELTFENGHLLARTDCSMAMLEVRLRQGLRSSEIPKDLLAWIDGSLRFHY